MILETLAVGAVILGTVLIMGAVIALSVAHVIWWSWWLYPAWAWFVVPLGVPQVAFWHFVGLMMLLRSRPSSLEKEKLPEETTEWVGAVSVLVIGPVIAWAVMYWLHT